LHDWPTVPFSDAIATSAGNQTVQTTRQSDAIGSLPQRNVQLFMALGTNRSDIEQAGSMAAKDAQRSKLPKVVKGL
jgi:hypothetical protein